MWGEKSIGGEIFRQDEARTRRHTFCMASGRNEAVTEEVPPGSLNEIRVGIAEAAVVAHRVPVLIAAIDGEGRAVGQKGDHLRPGAGGGAEV